MEVPESREPLIEGSVLRERLSLVTQTFVYLPLAGAKKAQIRLKASFRKRFVCGAQRKESLSRDQMRRAEAHHTHTHVDWGKLSCSIPSSCWCSKFQGQLTSCIDSAVFFFRNLCLLGCRDIRTPVSRHMFSCGDTCSSSCFEGLSPS